MNPHRTHKKNLIVSYKNLSDGLKQLFKETYPDGYSDYLQRFEKPNGDTIFVVPMETEDTVYMIKFDVKIDTTITDADADDDKDYFDEEIEKADHEFVPLSEAIEKEENSNAHTERSIRHGDYEEAASDKKRKGSLSSLGKELEEAFDNDEYAEDEYAEKEEAPENDDDLEPTDEELMDIDSDFYLEMYMERLAVLRCMALGLRIERNPFTIYILSFNTRRGNGAIVLYVLLFQAYH